MTPDLRSLWRSNWRNSSLRIGDRAIVRFSDGSLATGTVVPAPGQLAEPGTRTKPGRGIWIDLDDGRRWVAAGSGKGHLRRIGDTERGYP